MKPAAGKCSCLKLNHFKWGDLVKVVYVEKGWDTLNVGDVGSVVGIYYGSNRLEVNISGYIRVLYPQHIKKYNDK
jgi:hypothetical protein